MPLAIELAAGRLSTFSLADLADRLDRVARPARRRPRPPTPATGRCARPSSGPTSSSPSTSSGCSGTSSVFADGVDLAAAEAVAADLGLAGDPGALLAHLVDASMVDAVSDPAGRTRYRCSRPSAPSLATGWSRPARATRPIACWCAGRSSCRRGPSGLADGCARPMSARSLHRERGNLRAAWHLARAHGDLDAAVVLATSLSEIAYWQDLREVRGFAAELADDPALAGHPHESRAWGAAAQDAYLRGDPQRAERLARRGLDAADDGFGRRLCRSSLAQADLSRGAWDEAVAHDVSAIGLVDRPGPEPGVGALAALYGGDPVRAGSWQGWCARPTSRPCSVSSPTWSPRSTASRATPTPRRSGTRRRSRTPGPWVPRSSRPSPRWGSRRCSRGRGVPSPPSGSTAR